MKCLKKVNNAIHQRASNKVFAKLAMLEIDRDRLAYELKEELTGPISFEQLELIYKSTLTEIEVYKYMSSIIEKSNKSE